VEWKKEASVCVVICAPGYPGDVKTGQEIHGIQEASEMENVYIFHAGTKLEDNRLSTSGGRVLGVTATAPTLSAAQEKAYSAAAQIRFPGIHYRKDIAGRALEQFKR
jgi:phosphoribosylamine--glycine ligase